MAPLLLSPYDITKHDIIYTQRKKKRRHTYINGMNLLLGFASQGEKWGHPFCWRALYTLTLYGIYKRETQPLTSGTLSTSEGTDIYSTDDRKHVHCSTYSPYILLLYTVNNKRHIQKNVITILVGFMVLLWLHQHTPNVFFFPLHITAVVIFKFFPPSTPYIILLLLENFVCVTLEKNKNVLPPYFLLFWLLQHQQLFVWHCPCVL